MNVQKVIKQLKDRYPDKAIIQNKNALGEVTEIICETEPTFDHPDWSDSVVVLDKSPKHLHLEITEHYKVIKGELDVFVNDEKVALQEGETIELDPGKVHYAIGNETWLGCRSEPGWIPGDYKLVPEDTSKHRNVANCIFYNKETNEIALKKRGAHAKAGDRYALWGGGIDENETREQAISRELEEELGFIPEALEFWDTYSYVLDSEGKYNGWLIKLNVFTAPITDRILRAKVREGDWVVLVPLDQAIESDGLLPGDVGLLKRFRSFLKS
jgi:mutator protein MutT